jgi:excisionase family DNA binding protein
MNLADAIRLAARRAEDHPATAVPAPEAKASAGAARNDLNKTKGNEMKKLRRNGVPAPNSSQGDASFAIDAITDQPVRAPEPPSVATQTGTVVRLELFLSPEQMSGLFKAFMATQHTMLTLREAAGYLRIHPSTLEKMAQEGEIPALTIEGRWRFPKSNVDEWLTLQTYRNGGESNVA